MRLSNTWGIVSIVCNCLPCKKNHKKSLLISIYKLLKLLNTSESYKQHYEQKIKLFTNLRLLICNIWYMLDILAKKPQQTLWYGEKKNEVKVKVL